MDAEQLARERDLDLEQARRISEIIEPLIGWRDTLIRRANARTELLRPGVPQDAVEEALRAARNMIAHAFVPSAPGVISAPILVDELGPNPPFLISGTVGEGRAEFVGAAESPYEVGAVMEDVLETAGRPLHRDELFQRSKRHEFGPVNRSTLISRLSRDPRFEKYRPIPGYWMLSAWPPDRKRARVITSGRVYAETISRMERNIREAVGMANELARLSNRLRQMRSYREQDPERASTFTSEIAVTEQMIRRLTIDLRRLLRVLETERERAVGAHRVLGDEAEHYPGIPSLPDLDQVGQPARGPDPLPPDDAGEEQNGGDEP